MEVVEREGAAIGGLRLRIGVHTGPVVGGVLGHRKFAFDIWGETVNIASRLESHGGPTRAHATDATLRLVQDRFDADPLGRVHLRGYGPMDTYAIAGPRRRPEEGAPRADGYARPS